MRRQKNSSSSSSSSSNNPGRRLGWWLWGLGIVRSGSVWCVHLHPSGTTTRTLRVAAWLSAGIWSECVEVHAHN